VATLNKGTTVILFINNDFEIFMTLTADTHKLTQYEMNAIYTVSRLALPSPIGIMVK